MNWYYNKEGLAQGPLEEAAMSALFRDGDLTETSLIWQPGMSQWQSIRQLGPAWSRAAVERSAPAPAPSTLPPNARAKSPATGKKVEAESPRTPLRPLAPTEDAESAPKPSLLKRLFGRKKN